MSLYDFEVETLAGGPIALTTYAGDVALVVNTASKCGFTPQYAGLEALWRKYQDRGFVVLGFPCNQFGAQEPGDAAEIASFCSLTYDVSFPMFAKIDVNGPNAHPLYAWLKGQKRGLFGSQAIKWNFTKFLVDSRGKVVARFGPGKLPQALDAAVEALL
jgi:glutathione peroxidase